jgi:hypothetical protein
MEKMESSKSLTIPEIVEQVMNNLLVTPPKPHAPPKMLLPPPLPYPTAAPGSFPTPQRHYHKLSFPTYNTKKDLLPWINCCEQFFKSQCTPNNEKV